MQGVIRYITAHIFTPLLEKNKMSPILNMIKHISSLVKGVKNSFPNFPNRVSGGCEGGEMSELGNSKAAACIWKVIYLMYMQQRSRLEEQLFKIRKIRLLCFRTSTKPVYWLYVVLQLIHFT